MAECKQNTEASAKKEVTVKVYFDSAKTAVKKGAHAIGCRN